MGFIRLEAQISVSSLLTPVLSGYKSNSSDIR
jgi:hypothetical protein